MTDSEMEVILDMIDDIFQDQIKEGQHLKLNLDKEDFVAIIDEIRNTDVDELIEIRYVDSDETKKRTIH